MLVEKPQQISLPELKELCLRVKDTIKKIYLHWTAGRYSQVFDDYHINIGGNGEIFLTCTQLNDLKAHTWHRNSHSTAITLCCGLGAIAHYSDSIPYINFGPFPPTQEQIECMAKVIAVMTEALGMDISEDTILTHQEAATIDEYGPGSGDPETRWDLWYLPDRPITERMVQGGRVLRGKAIWYRHHLPNLLN